MDIDLHPIVVHFPIALLTLYSVLEVLRLPFIARQMWIFYTKALLLIVGFIGTYAAIETGERAAESFEGTPTMQVVELHERFANFSFVVYGVLAMLYLIAWIHRDGFDAKCPKALLPVWKVALKVSSFLWKWPVLVLLALLGFVLLSITGAFGGALVYGPDAAPFVRFLYSLFLDR